MVAVVFGGLIQLIAGFLKAGVIAQYFPSSVIQGMLAAIGILIFFKQISYAFGYDKNLQEIEIIASSENGNFLTIWFADFINGTANMFNNAINHFTPGVLIITFVSLGLLLFWQTKFITKNKVLSFVCTFALFLTMMSCQHYIGDETTGTCIFEGLWDGTTPRICSMQSFLLCHKLLDCSR